MLLLAVAGLSYAFPIISFGLNKMIGWFTCPSPSLPTYLPVHGLHKTAVDKPGRPIAKVSEHVTCFGELALEVLVGNFLSCG